MATGQHTLIFVLGGSTLAWTLVEVRRVWQQRSGGGDDDTPGLRARLAAFWRRDVTWGLQVLRQLALIAGVMLAVYLCEHHPPFPHGERDVDDVGWAWLLLGLFVVAGLLSLGKVKDEHALNRDQTEEWKGIMQFVFLTYHYYHVAAFYNPVRLFVSCYVWMTGFGNSSFFYVRGDFSFARFLKMMWRLNFSTLLLMLTLGNTYMLYYIVPLHTLHFLFSFTVSRIARRYNQRPWSQRAKVMAFGVVVWFVWEWPRVFDFVFGWLNGGSAAVGTETVAYHDLHFRTYLDHYSSLFGMVFAYSFPRFTRMLSAIKRTESPVARVSAQSLLVLIGVGALTWYSVGFVHLDKLQYNALHPYIFYVPLLGYVLLRNLFPPFLRWHSRAFASLGRITLETYLLQHHVFLTSNAKTLLVWLPGHPRLNAFVTLPLFLLTSRILFTTTIDLRALVLPKGATSSGIARRAVIMGVLALVAAAVGKVASATGAGLALSMPLAALAGVVVASVAVRRVGHPANAAMDVDAATGVGTGARFADAAAADATAVDAPVPGECLAGSAAAPLRRVPSPLLLVGAVAAATLAGVVIGAWQPLPAPLSGRAGTRGGRAAAMRANELGFIGSWPLGGAAAVLAAALALVSGDALMGAGWAAMALLRGLREPVRCGVRLVAASARHHRFFVSDEGWREAYASVNETAAANYREQMGEEARELVAASEEDAAEEA